MLGAESSVEDEIEALKAQAVVSRAFALKNLGRHAREGFDFCSTTHCQRFTFPKTKGAVNGAARRAVEGTAGVIFERLVGQRRRRVLSRRLRRNDREHRDAVGSACAVVPPRRARRFLRDDAASPLGAEDTGQSTRQGHAERRAHERRRAARFYHGHQTRRHRQGRSDDNRRFPPPSGSRLGFQADCRKSPGMADDQKLAVRSLAAGDDFIFRGSGFGHGLGFCQEGAHVAARRGMSHRQILNHYFPGTS